MNIFFEYIKRYLFDNYNMELFNINQEVYKRYDKLFLMDQTTIYYLIDVYREPLVIIENNNYQIANKSIFRIMLIDTIREIFKLKMKEIYGKI
jgi:hypothetical protein